MDEIVAAAVISRGATRQLRRQILGFMLIVTGHLPVAAEPVAIVASTRATGFGWLFGSPIDGACWIVTPRHVIEASRGGDPAPFLWRRQNGIEGTGNAPIVPDAALDLAFSPAGGIEPADCLSRLGDSDLTAILMRYPVTEAVSALKTQMRPRRMHLRDFDATLVRIEPADDAARKAFQSGISGSPLLSVEDAARVPRPLGLILHLDPQTNLGTALRFDTIKRVFLGMRNPESTPAPAASPTLFEIVNARAVTPSPTASAESLRTGGCWRAEPPAGERSFRFEIVVEHMTTELTIAADPQCGPPPDGLLLEAPAATGWHTIGQCTPQGEQGTCAWRFVPTARLRLTVIRRDSAAVGVSALGVSQ